MPKSHTPRGLLLASNLPQIQNLIKRDPVGYRDEFLQQHNHYLSLLRLHTAAPSSTTGASDSKSADIFAGLITFESQVAQCYPTDTADLPKQLRDLLLGNTPVLGDLRRTIVKNLVMLRNKDVIDSIELLQTLLPLLPRVSSDLRGILRHTILTDIKTSNSKTKNHKLNRIVQGLLFGMVDNGMSGEVVGDKGKSKKKEVGGEAMWAVMMVRELWKSGVWTDAKTVSIVALATFHPNTKVQSAAVHFFLGSERDADKEDDSSEEDEVKEARRGVKKLEHSLHVGKGSKKREKALEDAKKEATKKRRARAAGSKIQTNFPALEMLHDPQSFGEKLYDNLHRHDKQYSLDLKILIMQLLSRVMGSHKLCILGFYSFIIKYLTYHQVQVTLILVALAQSVHELTPPDVLTPCIRKIAHEFVHPGVSAEVIAAGINAIREVCRRQPWCMEEDLLGDLIEYRKSKDKGVVTAARGLLGLFREVNPGMLKKRERGKAASMGHVNQAADFGNIKQTEGIEGIELLEDHLLALQKEANPDNADSDAELEVDESDEAGWENWDIESAHSSSNDSSGWEDVISDDEDLEISDSDDEKPVRKRKRELSSDEERMEGNKAKSAKVNESLPSETAERRDAVSDREVSVAPSTTGTELSQTTKKLSLLAQQKILTPADFVLLNQLRLKAAQDLASTAGGSAARRKLAALEASQKRLDAGEQDGFLTESNILGPRKRSKQDYEERMESIRKGREGRERFGSLKGKKLNGSASSTNREKSRNKPIMMALHSNRLLAKKKSSLRDKQIALRASIEKQKKSKH